MNDNKIQLINMVSRVNDSISFYIQYPVMSPGLCAYWASYLAKRGSVILNPIYKMERRAKIGK